ncbi:hypothetical protein TVAGG3_0776150, partial [Trichomonas vaginalis G3]|uniref:hypothetical protein n=1 Tax=Trichomonas vaginalis (strain ATCC PRA-98 / G3) TaxID=412133 RepID=UPI0021E54AFF
MRKIVSFWETCSDNVSRNETCRPTRVYCALLSVEVLKSHSDCKRLSHSGRHAVTMSPRMRHADRQECTIHSCRSKFCNRVVIAKDCAIPAYFLRACFIKLNPSIQF